MSKLDNNFFHHMQPKCNINSCEMKTKKENSKNFRKNNDGTDLRRLPQVSRSQEKEIGNDDKEELVTAAKDLSRRHGMRAEQA